MLGGLVGWLLVHLLADLFALLGRSTRLLCPTSAWVGALPPLALGALQCSVALMHRRSGTRAFLRSAALARDTLALDRPGLSPFGSGIWRSACRGARLVLVDVSMLVLPHWIVCYLLVLID